ncbi:MAG: CFI-box-CTERM domain-containing protein [Pseudobdellovibrio sp.]
MPSCSSCSLNVPEIYPVEAQLRDRIHKLDPGFPIADQMCKSCLNDLRKKAYGSGGMLLAQERAKEDRKKLLWQSRVSLIKKGHALMANKLYSEAAVSYEKYLRVLELVFDCKPGLLNPESLKESAKTAELTIIVGVYWDLLRIYDSSDQYADRQKHAALQLAKFINYTPVFPDIMKKAQKFLATAKHPEVVKSFIGNAKKKRTRCFVATSAFESPTSLEVQFLRVYRDQTLKNSYSGRKFILFYYKISPSIASFLDQQTWLKPFVRAILRFVIKRVS